jgi:hypothetical protein
MWKAQDLRTSWLRLHARRPNQSIQRTPNGAADRQRKIS